MTIQYHSTEQAGQQGSIQTALINRLLSGNDKMTVSRTHSTTHINPMCD